MGILISLILISTICIKNKTYLRKTDKTLTNTEFSAKLKTMTETFNKLKSYGDGGSIQKSLQNIQNSFNELSRQHANWRNGVKTKIESVMNQFSGIEGDITICQKNSVG